MTPGTCEETAKVFDAVQPIDIRHVVRGQYAGYTSEPGVAPGLADRDPGRGAGRDRQLALGRSPVLPAVRQAPGRCQTVTLGFHEPPLRMFPIDAAGTPNGPRNEITIDFADRGSITAGFLAKEPGAAMRLSAAEMTFRYADSFRAASTLEGYQRLLLDAMLGDLSLFTSSDAIERLWEISAPLLEDRHRSRRTPPAHGARDHPALHAPSRPRALALTVAFPCGH